MSEQNNSKEQGFGSGLFFGMIAGISAYYFFGTKQGKELKTKLLKEFETAKDQIPPKLITITEEISETLVNSSKPSKSSSNPVSILKNIFNRPTLEEASDQDHLGKKKRIFKSNKTS